MASFAPDPEHVAWVNQRMLGWRQGDVATNLVEITHIADLSRPLTAAAAGAAAKLRVRTRRPRMWPSRVLLASVRRRWKDQPVGRSALTTGRATVTTETSGLVVLTQTCDLRRSADQRPFVDLAPLVTLEETVAKEAAQNMRPRYAPVPALGPRSFADLDVVLEFRGFEVAGGVE
jgi:hypothetical protein